MKVKAFLAVAGFATAANAALVPVTPADVNLGDTNTVTTTIGMGDASATFTPLRGGTVVTFNAVAPRLGIDGFGTNAAAFNDPDIIVGNENDEQLQIDFGATSGLASLGYDFSRGLVSISGFTSDPMASIDVTGNISGLMYDAGTLSFFQGGAGFNGTLRTVSLDPAASQGQTLLVSINDTNQAGAQLAIRGFSFENNIVPEPASMGLVLAAAPLLMRRRRA